MNGTPIAFKDIRPDDLVRRTRGRGEWVETTVDRVRSVGLTVTGTSGQTHYDGNVTWELLDRPLPPIPIDETTTIQDREGHVLVRQDGEWCVGGYPAMPRITTGEDGQPGPFEPDPAEWVVLVPREP